VQQLKQKLAQLEERQQPSQKFVAPSLQQVADYYMQREPQADTECALNFAEKFISHYENTGWMYGKRKMKDWKRAMISAWDTKKYLTNKPANNGTEKMGRIPVSEIQSFLNRG